MKKEYWKQIKYILTHQGHCMTHGPEQSCEECPLLTIKVGENDGCLYDDTIKRAGQYCHEHASKKQRQEIFEELL